MLKTLINAIYPDNVACALCGEEAALNALGVCASCATELIAPVQTPQLPYIDGFNAGLVYGGSAASAMGRLKYEGARYLAPFFAGFMRIDPSWRVQALIPVPLHISKEKKRGYNQSALLARALSKREGIVISEGCLKRTRDTGTQTNNSAEQRARNVHGAFLASGVGGARVALVDDVCTTGSTLAACAREIKNAGAYRVYAVCACYRPLGIM